MAYTKRSDGRYQTRIYIGKENGKKKFKYLYADSVSELKRLESEYRRLNGLGVDMLTIEDSYCEWLNRLKELKAIELTTDSYNTWFSRADFFTSYIGNIKLRNINQSDLQPAVNALFKCNPYTDKPTSKRTLQRYISACSDVFEYAIENRATSFNPCNFVKIPKNAIESERRALTETEQQWVRETEHRAQLPAMIMMYAGLRRGELTALTWNDIDLKEKTITVNKSYDFKERKIKSPKTESGNRIVSIPQILADYLADVRKESIYVVTTAEGQIMTDSAWRRLWSDYLCTMDNKYGRTTENISNKKKKAEKLYTISTFTPHCLRHTFCTLLYKSGIDVLTCKYLMGHNDVKTTLQVYTHLDAKYAKKSVEKLNTFLGTGVSNGVSKMPMNPDEY